MSAPRTLLVKTAAVPGCCFMAHFRNVGFIVWRTSADGQSARRAVDHVNLLVHDHARFSVIHILEATAGLPTNEGRKVLVDTARIHQAQVACVGVLLPDAGLTATLLTAFVRSMRTLVRGNMTTIVELEAPALVRAFLPPHEQLTGAQIDADIMTAAIAEARASARAAL